MRGFIVVVVVVVVVVVMIISSSTSSSSSSIPSYHLHKFRCHLLLVKFQYTVQLLCDWKGPERSYCKVCGPYKHSYGRSDQITNY